MSDVCETVTVKLHSAQHDCGQYVVGYDMTQNPERIFICWL